MKRIFEERIPITPEIYYLLRESDKLKGALELMNVFTELTPDNQSTILKSESKDNLETAKKAFFNPNSSNTFISIKMDDEGMKELFDGDPDETYTGFNRTIASTLSTLSRNRLYEFIPKERITDNSFEGKNVLIVLVEKSKEQELRDKIEGFIRSRTIECTLKIKKVLDETGKKNALKKYVEIGKELSESDETKKLINLIEAIQVRRSPFIPKKQVNEKDDIRFRYVDDHIPFIFVCASSGTGKTQLPFTMNIPMMYLINNKSIANRVDNSSTQEIYSNFIDISRCFFECVEKDIKIMNLEVDTVKDELVKINDHELFLPSFIYTLIAETYKIREDNEHWIESQLNIKDGFKFGRMKFEEARTKIIELFKGGLKPVIFLDESQMSGSDNFKTEYIYIRKLIRKLDLIPIFMGTNASLGNFVSSSNLSKESRSEERRCWCYVVHKLAPTSEVYISKEKKEILNLLNDDKVMNEKTRLFLDQMVGLMKMERPLFCHLVFEHLRNDIMKFSGDFDIFEALEDMLGYIFEEFAERKGMLDTIDEKKARRFNFNNITLMLPEYWKENVSGGVKKCKTLNDEKANGIHNHIGYLYVNDKVAEEYKNYNFIPIFNVKGIKVFGINKTKMLCKFEPYHVFARFREETLGELAFINRGNQDRILVREGVDLDGNLEIGSASVISAVDDIKDGYGLLPNISVKNTIEWASLEIKASLSCLLSSQCSGFGGCRFEEWLKCFVKNMTRSNENEDELKNILEVAIEYDEVLVQTRIPFCSPSIRAEWNSSFAGYLNSNGADLGITYAELINKESRDFYIRRVNSEEAIISGECKNYANGVSKSDIEEIIDGLNGYKSMINMIIVKTLKESCGNGLKEVAKEKKAILYRLIKNEDKYTLILAGKPNIIDEKTKRFIIMEVDDIE